MEAALPPGARRRSRQDASRAAAPEEDAERRDGADTARRRQELHARFHALDKNHDDYLSPDEVERALLMLRLPYTPDTLRDIFTHADVDLDGRLSYGEFERYAWRRERELRRIFSAVDRNSDGFVDAGEIRTSLHRLHLRASDIQIGQLMRRMTSSMDASPRLRFEEFRDFLLLLPDESLHPMLDAWAKASTVDVGLGEDFAVPDDVQGGKPAYLVNFVSGGVAGAVSRTLTAPLDRLKVLMQTGILQGRTLRQGLMDIHAEGGWPAFYRGNGSNVVKIIPESATKFVVYERLKNAIAQDPDNVRVRERFAAGAGAGLVSQSLIYPLEIAKTRLAVAAKGEYRGIFHCLNRTLLYEGPRGLYRGLGASLAGVAPYAGIDLMVFNTLKEHWKRGHEREDPNALTVLAFGATSSTMGVTVAYPLQLVPTKLQAQGMNAARPVVYAGPLDCFRQVVAKDGVRGLYRGILPNLLKTLPAVATTYVVYEEMRRALS